MESSQPTPGDVHSSPCLQAVLQHDLTVSTRAGHMLGTTECLRGLFNSIQGLCWELSTGLKRLGVGTEMKNTMSHGQAGGG